MSDQHGDETPKIQIDSDWKAEVQAMHTQNPYNPLKKLEVFLPIAFAVLYIAIYVYVLFI